MCRTEIFPRVREGPAAVLRQRRYVIRTLIRANLKIKVPKVRCINADGAMLGVVDTRDALRMANEQGLDLVEISPNADPPVCRIMDFGKFRYQESVKEKQARKHQHQLSVKEIKFHANIGDHDYQTKMNHIRGFLEKGHRVKITLVFRGREMAHRELGTAVVDRVVKDCADIGMVEVPPKQIGRIITGMIAHKPV
jgi:translation initiation factor IF-3